MSEKEPVKFCSACGYKCAYDSKTKGRFLEDLEGEPHLLNTKIEDCEARQIISSPLPISDKEARNLVDIPRKKQY